MNAPQLLEAAMLVCFGLAWPVANLRMLLTRRVEGKGMVFTMIILCGYVAGSLSKLAGAADCAAPAPMFLLYALNTMSVGVNLALQWYFGRHLRASACAM